MRVIDIENIVTNMRDDTRFVLRCEEVFHDKISSAAASILMNKGQKPIVCLTGPSGSGKTTTLYSCLQDLNRGDVNIVTAEDPVEYELAGVNQCHVNVAQGHIAQLVDSQVADVGQRLEDTLGLRAHPVDALALGRG